MCDKPQISQDDLKVWEVAINTQMHFNDLLIKMRTTVISIILAVFGTAVIALKDINFKAQIFNCQVPVGIIVLVIGLVFLFAQFLLDRFYYFRLLLGAVNFTRSLDKKYKDAQLLGLTESITKSMPQWQASLILFIYYLIPFILGILAIYIIQFKLIPVK